MLYVVATPIGNLEDLSIRQVKTIFSSDIILAEDTRSAQILIENCQKNFKLADDVKPSFKIISYYKDREFEKLPEIIDWLHEGKNICLISESGTPLISDPGYLLIKTAIKEGLPLTSIPGPSAIINSLVLSGFDPGEFMFLGFLPKKESQILRIIDKLKSIKNIFPDMVFVFYESPQRIIDTLQIIDQSKWNPDIVICREMTKKFEEVLRGKAEELSKIQYKGELTVLIK